MYIMLVLIVRSVRVNIGLDRDRADKSVKLFLVVK